jgi:hypothetical protein
MTRFLADCSMEGSLGSVAVEKVPWETVTLSLMEGKQSFGLCPGGRTGNPKETNTLGENSKKHATTNMTIGKRWSAASVLECFGFSAAMMRTGERMVEIARAREAR